MNDLYELKDELKNANTPQEMINMAWENSLKNVIAMANVAGMIDAFYYLGAITQNEFTKNYKQLGL